MVICGLEGRASRVETKIIGFLFTQIESGLIVEMMLMETMKMRITTEGETLAVITLLMRRSTLALIASMLTAVILTHAAHVGSGFDLGFRSVPTRWQEMVG